LVLGQAQLALLQELLGQAQLALLQELLQITHRLCQVGHQLELRHLQQL
jgi:hypothetical protein